MKQHGQDAPVEAAMRADELLEAGELEGFAVRKRIVKATEELLSKERPDGATRVQGYDFHEPGGYLGDVG